MPDYSTRPRGVIARLLKLAYTAHRLCDGADEGCKTVTVSMADYRALCEELDHLDHLPEVPNEAADGPRKAEYLIRVQGGFGP